MIPKALIQDQNPTKNQAGSSFQLHLIFNVGVVCVLSISKRLKNSCRTSTTAAIFSAALIVQLHTHVWVVYVLVREWRRKMLGAHCPLEESI